MLLPILPAEKEAHHQMMELINQIQGLERELNWNTPYTEKGEKIAKEKDALVEQLHAAQEDPNYVLYAVKTRVNEMVRTKVGNINAVLTLVEQTLLPSLEGETAGRVVGIIRTLAGRLWDLAGDPEIQAAKATATRNRYQALVNAGFEPNAALQIVVAEAGRPVNVGGLLRWVQK